jgi:hypothetical protein
LPPKSIYSYKMELPGYRQVQRVKRKKISDRYKPTKKCSRHAHELQVVLHVLLSGTPGIIQVPKSTGDEGQ